MFKRYDRSGGQANTSGTTKSMSKGAHGISIDVYNTCLGVYDRSGRQSTTSGTTKSMSKWAHATYIDVYNICSGVYDCIAHSECNKMLYCNIIIYSSQCQRIYKICFIERVMN